MIIYRAPQPGEEEAISECLHAAASLDEMTDGAPENIEEWVAICSPAEIRSRITSGDQSMVAVSDGLIVGYIAFRRTTHLSLLFVRKSHARQGIGRELFRRCSAALPFVTVNADLGAVGFYEKIGFATTVEPHLSMGTWLQPMRWLNPVQC